MAKVITLRLSEEEYRIISTAAHADRRPISNFITNKVMEEIGQSYFIDPIEMAQIKSDTKLFEKLKIGHNEARANKGRFVD